MMREDTTVVMDIPPKETFKKFVARWYGYNSCSYSEYADSIFKQRVKGSVYVERYNNNGHCTIFGTEETVGNGFIKYSATFVNRLGEI
jgi:hypothetical protein